jgi:hypothetical protein
MNAIEAAVLGHALPGHHETAASQHRHNGVLLLVGRRRVDPELAALGHATAVVALAVNAVAAAVLAAFPDDDEVAAGVHGNHRQILIAGGVGADMELTALHHAAAVVALGVDAFVAAILTEALPGNDEIA